MMKSAITTLGIDKMTNAGIEAIENLTMNTTMDQKGIRMSTTETRLGRWSCELSCDIGYLLERGWDHFSDEAARWPFHAVIGLRFRALFHGARRKWLLVRSEVPKGSRCP